MTRHVSDFALDLLAVGHGSRGDERHVDSCDGCKHRLEKIRAARSKSQRSPRYEQVRRTVDVAHAPVVARPRWTWALLAAPVAAAAIVLAIDTGGLPRDGTRVKGDFHVGIEQRGESEDAIAAGERVSLAVGAAGHGYVIVYVLEDDGDVELVWPVGGERSGPAPTGARGELTPSFRVTPGSFTLLAIFSDEPIAIAASTSAIRRAVAKMRAAGKAPRDTEPDPLPGEVGRARAHIDVRMPATRRAGE